MSGHNPEWQDYQGENGLTEQTYGEPSQEEGLHQIQSYYDDGYNYRGRGYNSGRANYHRQDYTRDAAYTQGGAYDYSYSHEQYQNSHAFGYQNNAWGAEYHGYGYANGSEVPYAQGYYYDAPQNPQYHPRPARFQPQGRRHEETVAPTALPPRSPSPTYLSTSLSPSLSAEAPSRKLLILDLNGTLLYRPKPVFQPRPPRPIPPSNPQNSEDEAPSSHPFHPHTPAPFQPLKRLVYTRPYLSCFREYLFHPSTRQWLDVMIWSSAQPHSVKDMLQRCFPAPEEKPDGDKGVEGKTAEKSDDRFIAVWARDTLGLSSVDYSRKTQTTKDLHKPWSQLPPLVRPDQPSDTAPACDQESLPRHSAHTTLLLDDSPRKAHLQPWNHVCLREYGAEVRDEDVKALEALQRETRAEKRGEENSQEGTHASDSPAIAAASHSSPVIDPTLLAVIGVLEVIKLESNVAGWIRAGGLWADRRNEKLQTDLAVPVEGNVDTKVAHIDSESSPPHRITTPEPTGGIKRGRDAKDTGSRPSSPETGPAKRPRLESSEAPADSDTVPNLALDQASNPVPPSSLPAPTPRSPPTPSPGPGNDGGGAQKRDGDDSGAVSSQQSLWFSHAPTFNYWVDRGREALRDLGIGEEHGVMIDQEIEG